MIFRNDLLAVVSAVALGGCLWQGTASGPVTGAAPGGHQHRRSIVRCPKTLGTIVIDHGR